MRVVGSWAWIPAAWCTYLTSSLVNSAKSFRSEIHHLFSHQADSITVFSRWQVQSIRAAKFSAQTILAPSTVVHGVSSSSVNSRKVSLIKQEILAAVSPENAYVRKTNGLNSEQVCLYQSRIESYPGKNSCSPHRLSCQLCKRSRF